MKKILALALCVLLLLFAFVGCSASRDSSDSEKKSISGDSVMEAAPEAALSVGSYSRSYGSDYYDDYDYDYNEYEPTSAAVPGEAVSTNRKLIRRVSLSVETEEYDVLLNDISARITACGGYLESMSADTRYSSDSRYAYMTVRVPATRLDEFVTSVSGISNVVQRSENTEDVTLSYVDVESRTNALRTEQDRLIALLEQAANLTEILEIEDRLADVRYQLEYMESQLRTYDNLVDYATVSLSISEVRKLTPTVEKGFWEKAGDGFMESIDSIWEGIKNFFSSLIAAVPYLIIIVVCAAVVFIIIFVSIRKSRKKAAKRQRAPMPQPQGNAAPEQKDGNE